MPDPSYTVPSSCWALVFFMLDTRLLDVPATSIGSMAAGMLSPTPTFFCIQTVSSWMRCRSPSLSYFADVCAMRLTLLCHSPAPRRVGCGRGASVCLESASTARLREPTRYAGVATTVHRCRPLRKWSPQGNRVPCPLVLGVHLQGKQLRRRDLCVAHLDRPPAMRAADHDHLEHLDGLLAQIALERDSLEPLADVAKQVASTCSTFAISTGRI
jgi:hypothetical protein